MTVLVDTGVGPPGLWGWTAEHEGELPEALGRLGVSRDQIDVVFLTHLHIDHVGWNTDLEGAAFFPRARYVVHRDALAFVRSHDERPHVRRCIGPFSIASRRWRETSSWLRGSMHSSRPATIPVIWRSASTQAMPKAVLIADVAVHPALLEEPEWLYVSDGDPAQSAATRRALLPELVDRDVLVACGHYPGSGIGRVVTRDGRPVWQEAPHA